MKVNPIQFIFTLFSCDHLWEHYGGFSVCIKCNKMISTHKKKKKQKNDKYIDTYES